MEWTENTKVDHTMRAVEHEIEALYQQYYRPLCLLAHTELDDMDLAQDVVQDFFINYWERRSQGVDIPDNFLAYARRAVRNRCVDFHRRKQVSEKRRSEITSPEPEFVDPQEHVEEQETYQARLNRIFELIDQLPEGQRQILKLHALDKLSYAQIATYQNVSVNTVRTQLTRAYTRLRKTAPGLALLALLRYF